MTTRTDNDLLAAVEALAPLIVTHRDEGERERRLPLPVVEAMTRAGLFRMLMLVELGGSETDLPAVLRVFEAAARADGAAGWNLMICATSALVLAHRPDDVARQIVSDDPDLIIGGSANPMGKAMVVDGGYRVTARWPFGSGCQQSTWLGGASLVFEDGAPRPRPPWHGRKRYSVRHERSCSMRPRPAGATPSRRTSCRSSGGRCCGWRARTRWRRPRRPST